MTFSELIKQSPADRVLLITGDKHLTAQAICSRIEKIRKQCIPHTARIALETDDHCEALIWMIALDGLVTSVFLVPKSIKQSSDYPELRHQAKCTHAISNQEIVELPSNHSALNSTDETEWLLATSGTTGTPKLIPHSRQSLTRTCKTDHITGRMFTWGLVYDPFRFAGLQVVLQALSSQSTLVMCDVDAGINQIIEELRAGSVNALSATPSFWRKLLMSGKAAQLNFRQITLGGEPVDQSILDALKNTYPLAKITHIYASTEVGVGFAVKDGKAGFPADFLKQTFSAGKLKISEDGTLLLQMQNTTTTDTTFTLLNTGDLVEQKGNRIYFLGRDSGAINVGGNKVIPEMVESVIRQLPEVAEAVVRPKKNSVLGQLVTAEIVAADTELSHAQLKDKIVAHCKASLETYQVPVLIKFVDEIVVNTTGKISRI